MVVVYHGKLYQRRLKKAFDKKISPRYFEEGDLVLRKILPIHKDPRGKWTPNYEGSYIMKKVFSSGALILTTMDKVCRYRDFTITKMGLKKCQREARSEESPPNFICVPLSERRGEIVDKTLKKICA